MSYLRTHYSQKNSINTKKVNIFCINNSSNNTAITTLFGNDTVLFNFKNKERLFPFFSLFLRSGIGGSLHDRKQLAIVSFAIDDDDLHIGAVNHLVD